MNADPWSILEAIGALGNLVYTVLMLYEKRVGWIFGIVASALGIVLFLEQRVYAQVGLSAFYVVMGVYGWWSWGRNGSGELPITRRALPFHGWILLGGAALTICIALLMKSLPDARMVGLDGFATAFSLLATWMLARKILENWAYWILADMVAIYLYMMLGMYWYVALYAIYVVLSVAALMRWNREMKPNVLVKA